MLRRWVTMWKGRKLVLVGLCCFVLVLRVFVAGAGLETASEAAEGPRLSKSYRGTAPLLCVAFVSESGRPLRLARGMAQVYRQLQEAKRLPWEAVLLDVGGSEGDVAALRKRFALDVVVQRDAAAAHSAEFAVNAAVLGVCRAPFVLLLREESGVVWESATTITGQIARLKRPNNAKAVGAYIESVSGCEEDKLCPVPPADYAGALLLDREKLVATMPAFLEEQHVWNRVVASPEHAMGMLGAPIV